MAISARTSKIFVRNLTVLDCAVWSLHNGPEGRSWNVDVEWTGLTDAEGVVIDFSAAKKLAKHVIDTLFDHRLLISEELVQTSREGRCLCLPSLTTQHDKRFYLDTYRDSLAILPHFVFEELAESKLRALAQTISDALQRKCPDNISSVKVILSPHTESKETHFFNYLHSLRLHSGNCQRFHGHSNTIEVHADNKFDAEKSAMVAKFLDGKYLIPDVYLGNPDNHFLDASEEFLNHHEMNTEHYLWAFYTGSQGQVAVRFPKQQLILMNDESTIENIAKWIHENLFNSDSSIQVTAFEGLHKGSVYP